MLLDRSYFALQQPFAERIAALTGLSRGEAYRLHTTFYALARDNDAGLPPERNDFDPSHPKWVAFVDAIERGADPVDHVYDDYLDGDAQGDDGSACFTFAYWPDDRLVRLHFSNDRDGTALRPETVEDRRRELRAIFSTIAAEHPEAEVVRGTSWLYNLDAYRRLFPPGFVADLRPTGKPHQFAALWAQFIDRHGVVKPALAERFLAAVDVAGSVDALDAAFPLDALAATAGVEIFFDDLGIDR